MCIRTFFHSNFFSLILPAIFIFLVHRPVRYPEHLSVRRIPSNSCVLLCQRPHPSSFSFVNFLLYPIPVRSPLPCGFTIIYLAPLTFLQQLLSLSKVSSPAPPVTYLPFGYHYFLFFYDFLPSFSHLFHCYWSSSDILPSFSFHFAINFPLGSHLCSAKEDSVNTFSDQSDVPPVEYLGIVITSTFSHLLFYPSTFFYLYIRYSSQFREKYGSLKLIFFLTVPQALSLANQLSPCI